MSMKPLAWNPQLERWTETQKMGILTKQKSESVPVARSNFFVKAKCPDFESNPASTGDSRLELLAQSLACPRCGRALERRGKEELYCFGDNLAFACSNGIFLLLDPERQKRFQHFLSDYETIRRCEGRGSQDPDFYRALPFNDLTQRHSYEWTIRAKSFQVLSRLAPGGSPLNILDLGAGNCWLTWRLAQAGHSVAAVDLSVSEFDGLGAWAKFGNAGECLRAQAEFDRLPFQNAGFDVVIYNGSFHYATDCARSLQEALRVLRPAGRIIIMDSPIYRRETSGLAMLEEKRRQFWARYRTATDALPMRGYLTYEALIQLGASHGLIWDIHRPWYGWRWHWRPLRARLSGQREPAAFALIVGRLPLDRPASCKDTALNFL